MQQTTKTLWATRTCGFLTGLLLLATTAAAQCTKERPKLQPLRYEEDWSLLSDKACRKEVLDSIKYFSLGRQDWYLTLGGEIRYRYENYEDPGFGVGPETPSGYILQRYLLHTDWHFGRRFRLFAQFQSGLEEGRNPYAPACRTKMTLFLTL